MTLLNRIERLEARQAPSLLPWVRLIQLEGESEAECYARHGYNPDHTEHHFIINRIVSPKWEV